MCIRDSTHTHCFFFLNYNILWTTIQEKNLVQCLAWDDCGEVHWEKKWILFVEEQGSRTFLGLLCPQNQISALEILNLTQQLTYNQRFFMHNFFFKLQCTRHNCLFLTRPSTLTRGISCRYQGQGWICSRVASHSLSLSQNSPQKNFSAPSRPCAQP